MKKTLLYAIIAMFCFIGRPVLAMNDEAVNDFCVYLENDDEKVIKLCGETLVGAKTGELFKTNAKIVTQYLEIFGGLNKIRFEAVAAKSAQVEIRIQKGENNTTTAIFCQQKQNQYVHFINNDLVGDSYVQDVTASAKGCFDNETPPDAIFREVLGVQEVDDDEKERADERCTTVIENRAPGVVIPLDVTASYVPEVQTDHLKSELCSMFGNEYAAIRVCTYVWKVSNHFVDNQNADSIKNFRNLALILENHDFEPVGVKQVTHKPIEVTMDDDTTDIYCGDGYSVDRYSEDHLKDVVKAIHYCIVK
ncbi:MAG: hypothetical protein UT48_C0032G0006 [Parcubacteria group bacterium GW2011_GWE2_39_37]|uniref:Uncharacterized protein n=1 Tax=Candidatus Falkowbacteria bacterium GW2011_GWF2_39_8 TaxID=1618642 RepID=A0A0G0T7T6_9BACT|nr:MAG: hypothetical protein UT48_C0032G0006 [Parcubacteria group bacterium GW2011_GWE2_39_37]KKR33927.1 MAG: hypothetical protein UT64_C0001G0001 [Candidatus Falkowbacteria bacterium GW2011_GWF2_39_8]